MRQVVEPRTRAEQSFLLAWLEGEEAAGNLTQVWVGYRRATHAPAETQYLPFNSSPADIGSLDLDWESSGLDFTAAAQSAGGGDCVVMVMAEQGGHRLAWQRAGCGDTASVVCQTEAGPSHNLLSNLAVPEVMLPLDRAYGVQDYNVR